MTTEIFHHDHLQLKNKQISESTLEKIYALSQYNDGVINEIFGS